MRTFTTIVVALLLLLGTFSAKAAPPRPMARAQLVLGKALGLKGARVEIKATHALKSKQQLVSFSVVVPSIFSNAGVAYVGTALLKEGRNGKASSARVNRLDIQGTGVFSGLYEHVGQKAQRSSAVKASARARDKHKSKRAHTPWGTRLK